jgi:hypothetical protein
MTIPRPHDQANCTHPDCRFEAEFGYNPADPLNRTDDNGLMGLLPSENDRDNGPPDKCGGGCVDGVLPDPLNPGQYVTCDVCWGEGDEERNKQIIADQMYYADLADAQSY